MTVSSNKCVRIGCYSAFLGDSPEAAAQLVNQEGPRLNYLVADYLAEVTMGVLAMRRQVRLAQGDNTSATTKQPVDYIPQFIKQVLARNLPALKKNGTKVITNAGALDPLGCKLAVEELARKLNVDIKVAAVYGDDLMMNEPMTTLSKFRKDIVPFSPLSVSHHDIEADRLPVNDEPIVSMNAYLGAFGIAAALDSGADIVVTGRVVDSAIVVGPLLHEFRWQPQHDNFFDLLGSASLAGHIIECGCHATGGNFTDWQLAAQSPHGGYANMGYPIVEFQANGEFVVTKPENTGGLVSVGTVSEQILYETLDPALYILPDVITDLRQVKLTQVGKDRVHVSGARGRKPTPLLKCCGIFVDGWQLSGELYIAGTDAKAKAIAVGNAIIERTRRIFREQGIDDYKGYNIEPVGGETLYGTHATANHTREVILRVSALHENREALQILNNEILAPITGMAPGTGLATFPVVRPNLVHFPCLIPKLLITTKFNLGSLQGSTEWGAWDDTGSFAYYPAVDPIPDVTNTENLVKVKLIDVAYGRSGDKGNVSNIGIIARSPKYLSYIKRSVTPSVISSCMKHICHGQVKMYELPGLNALNFVLTQSLGGGALSSLIVDRQGKAFAQVVLSLVEVEIPADMLPLEPAKL